MKEDKYDELAFPFIEDINLERGYQNTGMTLRDYFAAKAIIELSVSIEWSEYSAYKGTINHYWPPEKVAERAYKIAEAMLKIRNKEETNG